LIIDPIDGTRNFVRGIPVFGALLAVEARGEVVAGVVSAPALRMRWHAARGAGALRDGRRLEVSRIRELREATLFHGNLGPGEAAPAVGPLPSDRPRGSLHPVPPKTTWMPVAVGVAALISSGAPLARTGAARPPGPLITVYKSATCGCCTKWVEHVRAAGFQVVVH